MEIARAMKPPPPPPETVQGYNPLMDEPLPTLIEDYLRCALPLCNVVFVDRKTKGTMISYS